MITSNTSEIEFKSLAKSSHANFFVKTAEESEEAFLTCLSPYAAHPTLMLLYSDNIRLLEGIPIGNDAIKFAVPQDCGYISNAFLVQELPGVTVVDPETTRVRWIDDIGIHLFPSSSIISGENFPVNSLSSLSALNLIEWCTDNNHYGEIMYDLGARPELTEWSDELPPAQLRIYQPWFYTMGAANAFSVDKLGDNRGLSHKCTLRNRISQLLQMQVISEDGRWVDAKLNMRAVEISGERNDNKLEAPSMWVETSSIPGGVQNGSDTFFIRDVVTMTETVDTGKNTSAEFKISVNNGLVRYYFTEAILSSAKDRGEFSMFTCEGRDPIKSVTKKIDGETKYSLVPAAFFRGQLTRNHFKRTPIRQGLHAIAVSNNAVDSPTIDVGDNSKDSEISMSFELDNTGGHTYTINLHCVTHRAVKIENGSVTFPQMLLNIT